MPSGVAGIHGVLRRAKRTAALLHCFLRRTGPMADSSMAEPRPRRGVAAAKRASPAAAALQLTADAPDFCAGLAAAAAAAAGLALACLPPSAGEPSSSCSSCSSSSQAAFSGMPSLPWSVAATCVLPRPCLAWARKQESADQSQHANPLSLRRTIALCIHVARAARHRRRVCVCARARVLHA